LINGSNTSFTLGKSNTTNNQAEITYYHLSDASDNNRLGLSLKGKGGINILGNGNVGIGITNPKNNFDISGNTTIKGNLDVSNNITVNNTSIILTNNGKLGVGLNPVYNLDISGNVNITGNYYQNGKLYVDPVPVGSILSFTGSTLPQYCGWCDGSAVSRSQYPELFTLIGTLYGSGDGQFTFNLPDLRGRDIIGAGQGTGLTNRSLAGKGGEENHTLTTNEIPAHNHDVYISTSGRGLEFVNESNKDILVGDYGGSYTNVNSMGTNYIKTTGGSQSHNNMQPYLVCNYIIKLESTCGINSAPYNHWSRDISANISYTTGKIGIGTSNPGTTLDIQGSLNLTSNLYKNGVSFGTFNAIRKVFTNANGQTIFDISTNNIVDVSNNNIEIYKNGIKLVYLNPSKIEYNTITIQDVSNNYTIIRTTLTNSLTSNNDILDITIWPTNVSSSSSIRYNDVYYQRSDVGTIGPQMMLNWGYMDLSKSQVFSLNQEPGNPGNSMFNGSNFLFQDKTGENGQWNYARLLFRGTTISGTNGNTVSIQIQSNVNSLWNNIGSNFTISTNDPSGINGYNTYSSPWFSHTDIGINNPSIGIKILDIFNYSTNTTDINSKFRLGQVWIQFKAT
jgi:microcystin-dependent protein